MKMYYGGMGYNTGYVNTMGVGVRPYYNQPMVMQPNVTVIENGGMGYGGGYAAGAAAGA